MGLDAGAVLKRTVFCPHCNADYYYTLRTIADNRQLTCHGCREMICLSDSIYESLLREVRNSLETIRSAQLSPSFICGPSGLAV
jgi:hypothetical protein